ncbi:MAG: preprotein translocase subunit SecG [Isosphaeraceae bacterium]
MDFIIGFLNILIVLGSLFLICIILIQRGKGGGLAGAFGGVGGSSAFGTKAGDVFTKITIGVAAGWILAAMILVVLTNRRNYSAFENEPPTSVTKELAPKSKAKPGASDLGAGEVPPPTPTPAKGTPASSPPFDLPPVPDIPAIAPMPEKSAPAATPAPSAPATPGKATSAPAPAPSTPAPAPAKPASTPK